MTVRNYDPEDYMLVFAGRTITGLADDFNPRAYVRHDFPIRFCVITSWKLVTSRMNVKEISL